MRVGWSTISGANDYTALPRQNKEYSAVAGLGNKKTEIGRADVVGEYGVNLGGRVK